MESYQQQMQESKKQNRKQNKTNFLNLTYQERFVIKQINLTWKLKNCFLKAKNQVNEVFIFNIFILFIKGEHGKLEEAELIMMEVDKVRSRKEDLIKIAES